MGVIIALIIAGIILYLYILAIGWFFSVAALPVLRIGSALFIILILVNYIRAVYDVFAGRAHGLHEDKPIPPEPAYKNYFFRKAYFDYWDIVKLAWEYNFEHAKFLIEKNTEMLMSPVWFLTWPLALTLYGVFLVAAVAAAAGFLFFGLLHLLIVTTLCVLAYIVALYLRAIEWISMQWRKISYVCPHPDCYKPIALPLYICPKCGEVHRRLMPGSYGISRRRCACDDEKLPTLAIFGRRDLPSLCPHCQKPLNREIGSATNIHIPIIGGPSAGKTNFLMASVMSIEQDSQKHKRKMVFPDNNDERIYQRNKQLFQHGNPVDKTPELSPKSFLLKILEPNGAENLIYIYDAAGELYTNTQDVRRLQKYFSYVDGIILLVDPFSVERIRIDYREKIAAIVGDLKPSSESPQNVYDRFINTLRDFNKRKRMVRKLPLTVVVTKADALDLKKQLGLSSSANSGTVSEAHSATIRQWLVDHGERNLVSSIERDFANVSYMACSALGDLPSGNKPFQPVGVLAPVQWILERRKVRIAGEAKGGVSLKSERAAYALGFALITAVYLTFFWGAGTSAASLIPENTGAIISREAQKSLLWFGYIAGIPPEFFNANRPPERTVVQPQRKVVTVAPASGLNLRSAPNAASRSNVMRGLPQGLQLVILEKRSVNSQLWCRVQAPSLNNLEGWVFAGPNGRYLQGY